MYQQFLQDLPWLLPLLGLAAILGAVIGLRWNRYDLERRFGPNHQARILRFPVERVRRIRRS